MDKLPVNNYGPLGCTLGFLLAIILYLYPVPVVLIVWWLDLKGLFADYMYLALPFLAALPLIGFAIGVTFSKRPDEMPDPPPANAPEKS